MGPHPTPTRPPTWVVPQDVTGVLQHLVVLLLHQQALTVVENQGVDHLFQLQPLHLPGLLLRSGEKSAVSSGCGPTLTVTTDWAASHLGLQVPQADDGFLVLGGGLTVAAQLEEPVSFSMEDGHRMHLLIIAQVPGLPLILAGGLHLAQELQVNEVGTPGTCTPACRDQRKQTPAHLTEASSTCPQWALAD